MITRLKELVAATHTPFNAAGELDLSVVETQAEHLLRDGVTAAFIGGTTGESQSLTVAERLALAERWAAVAKGSPLRVLVHVGANCLPDARALAAQAQRLGAAAIAAMAPSYFKPSNVEALVESCRFIAEAAPDTPFYYYDIPIMTGVHLSIPDFLDAAAARVPTLAGVKFTNPDLMAFQQGLRSQGGRFDLLWGMDECLLAALAVGAQGAVGSTYNFAAPVYHRLIRAFQAGDLPAAREAQYQSIQMIALLVEFGFVAAAKAVMTMLAVPVGTPRLPNSPLSPEQHKALKTRLSQMGFFDWVGTSS